MSAAKGYTLIIMATVAPQPAQAGWQGVQGSDNSSAQAQLGHWPAIIRYQKPIKPAAPPTLAYTPSIGISLLSVDGRQCRTSFMMGFISMVVLQETPLTTTEYVESSILKIEL